MTITSKYIYTDTTNYELVLQDKKQDLFLKLTLWAYSTSSSWGHKGNIRGHIKDMYCKKNDVKNRYYNRTWERYTFQSTIRDLLEISGLFDNKSIDRLMARIDKKASREL